MGPKAQRGKRFLNLSAENVIKMKQYFILSQLNDWNTQGIVEGCNRKITGENFPLDEIKDLVQSKNRVVELRRETLECNVWFSLKVMTPSRLYINQKNTTGRYKPELDHIFPMKLESRPEDYEVDTLWNFQPVAGKTNLLKSNIHPHIFFTNEDTKKHISEYDFLPESLTSDEWNNHKLFIEKRRERMIDFMKTQYNIDVI